MSQYMLWRPPIQLMQLRAQFGDSCYHAYSDNIYPVYFHKTYFRGQRVPQSIMTRGHNILKSHREAIYGQVGDVKKHGVSVA